MREVGRAEHASTEQLSALLDGRAEPDELVFLAGHVEQCIICSHELADLRAVRDLLRALPVYVPPRSFTIPLEASPTIRRFGLLIPLTRVMGTVAAVLCVVLFSVDAMQSGYEAPAAVPDSGAGTMHFTTTRSTMDSDRQEDAAAKVTDATAAPAAAAKPAAAFAPSATQGPISTPIQSIANTVTATPPGLAAKPSEPAGAAESARSRAEGSAAAPPPPQQPQPAAAQAQPATAGQAQSAAAAQQPAAAQAKPAAPAAAQPAPARQAPGEAAKPQAPGAPPAPQPTSAAFAPGPPAPTAAPGQVTGGAPQPAQAQQPTTPTTVTSPWLSPIRLWSLAFALIAAALLIASLVLSRISRSGSGPSDEWSRS